MADDSYIQVPADAGGKKVETEEVVSNDGLTVQRQRVAIPDEVSVGGEWLTRILIEQRVQNLLLAEGLGVNDDVEGLRDELSDVAGLTQPTVLEVLTEDRTYYVSTTGSDSNNGLTNTSDGAFLTLQGALDYLKGNVEPAGFVITLQFAAGTYTGSTQYTGGFGAGVDELIVQGDTTTPSNVVLTSTSGHTVEVVGPGSYLSLTGFKITSSAGHGVRAADGAYIQLGKNEYGACAQAQITLGPFALLYIYDDYAISAGAEQHINVQAAAAEFYDLAITITNTPDFSGEFIRLESVSSVQTAGTTYTGGATGPRYDVRLNSVINTFGGGANYFPGDSVGTTATGGVYG